MLLDGLWKKSENFLILSLSMVPWVSRSIWHIPKNRLLVKIAKNIEKNYEKVWETLRNLPKTLQGIPADGLERFWDIMGVKNIFYLHFTFKITVFE